MPQGSPRLIRHATDALLRILRDALALPADRVVAAPPETVPRLDADDQIVVLYLYRVEESAELKNQGPDYEVVPSSDGAPAVRVRRDPLSLNLHYLLIPFSGASSFLDTYELLGHAMLALHDNGIFSPAALGVADLTDAEAEIELRITKEPLTTQELAAIWEAVQEPYRLSVSYCVRTVQLQSLRSIDGRRVTDRRFEAGEIGTG